MPSPQLKPSAVTLPDESTDDPLTTAMSGVPEPELSGVPSQLKPPAESAIAAAAISTRMRREAERIICATRESFGARRAAPVSRFLRPVSQLQGCSAIPLRRDRRHLPRGPPGLRCGGSMRERVPLPAAVERGDEHESEDDEQTEGDAVGHKGLLGNEGHGS